jgi:glycosyltransferase involved in cell wall biosynthesis
MVDRVLVIIPALNEEATVADVIASVGDHLDADILVVDDGSRDATAERAVAAGATVLRHPFNLGVGAALRTGFQYARAEGYQSAVQLDADGQHDPAFLEGLLRPVREGECDVCIGSRYVSRTAYRAPAARRLGMLVFSGVVRLALRQRIADTTSGFRAYSRPVMQLCQHDFPKDFPDAPLLIALVRSGFRLMEIPVEMRERRAGRSFYTFARSLYYPYKNLVASLMAWIRRPA